MEEKRTITIDGKEYIYEDLPDTVKTCINQIGILEREIESKNLELDRLKVSKMGFLKMVGDELKQTESAEPTE